MVLFDRWAPRPLFVSSTFEDFHAERDFLQTVVLPQLAAAIRPARHRLEPIDLRWGIDTLSIDGGEEARHLLVLRYCLDSIEKCQPFLIVLVGDRYGWVPPEEAARSAAAQVHFYGDIQNKSVTALEIEFGVLSNSDQQLRTHFFFRRLPHEAMSEADRQRYSDAERSRLASDPAERERAAESAARLVELRRRIAEKVPAERLHEYTAMWDADGRQVSGLEELGRLIIEHVGRDLQEEVASRQLPSFSDWMQSERHELDEFLDFRTRIVCGRDAFVGEWVDYCLSDVSEPEQAVCITGVPGAGKSSVFALLHRQLDPTTWRMRVRNERNPVRVRELRGHLGRLEQRRVLLLAHAAGMSRRSVSGRDVLRRWLAEITQALGQPCPETDLPLEELAPLFDYWLRAACAKQRVILLVDALNQMERTPSGRFVQWLPRSLPANARLIATAIPGDETNEFSRRAWRNVPLPALTAPAIDEVFAAVCEQMYNREGQGFANIRQALAEKIDPTTGQPAGGNPLWLRLALDQLNQLGEDFFARQRLPEYASLPGDMRLNRLMLDLVQREIPGDVPTLYGWMLRRAEAVAGYFGRPEWARWFACLIAVTRNGLREDDLRELLPRLIDEPWSDLRLAALRRAFSAHLVERGDLGQWDFFHVQMREAVRLAYLSDPAEERRLHRLIAEYLTARAEDELRVREAMYHWLHSGERLEAARYLAGLPLGAEVEQAAQVLAEHIARGERREGGNDRLGGVLAIVSAEGQSDGGMYWVTNHCQFHLLDALVNSTKVGTRVVLMLAVCEQLQDLVERVPENDRYDRALSVSIGLLGDLHLLEGQSAEFRVCIEKCLQIHRQLTERLVESNVAQRDLSVTLERLGTVHLETGRHEDARLCFEESARIRNALVARQPDSFEAQRDLSVSLHKLGCLHFDAGRKEIALGYLEQSLEIDRGQAERQPNRVEAQRNLALSLEWLGEMHWWEGDHKRAQDYYEESRRIREGLVSQMPESVKDLRNLLVSLGKLGELHLKEGCRQEAQSNYEECLRIARDLVKRVPDNIEAQRDLSFSLELLGGLHQTSSKTEEARILLEESWRIRTELAARLPENIEAQRDLARSWIQQGDLHLHERTIEQARYCFDKAIRIDRALSNRHPDNMDLRRDLSVSLNKRGTLYLQMGQRQEASRCFEESFRIRSAIIQRHPHHLESLRDVAISMERLGELCLGDGQLEGAREWFLRVLQIRTDLATRVPDDLQAQLNRAIILERLGELCLRTDRRIEAYSCFVESLGIVHGLATASPDSFEVQRSLSVSYFMFYQFHQSGGNEAAAREALRQCYLTLRRMRDDGMGLDQQAEEILKWLEGMFGGDLGGGA